MPLSSFSPGDYLGGEGEEGINTSASGGVGEIFRTFEWPKKEGVWSRPSLLRERRKGRSPLLYFSALTGDGDYKVGKGLTRVPSSCVRKECIAFSPRKKGSDWVGR